MFRPSTNTPTKSGTSPSKQSNNVDSSAPTIREVRSRAVGSSINSRHLLSNRRQAMSMERLNSSSSSSNSNMGLGEKEKSSPTSGSSNSINGSNASSPLRGSSSTVGLNRTASRVSRFRTAKAVFERLSNANASARGSTSTFKSEKPPEKPRGTVASRYAAAAAARAAAAQQQLSSNSNSPSRSRFTGTTSSRVSDSLTKSSSSTSVNEAIKTPSSPKHETTSQPRPQPRVVAGIGSRKSPATTATIPTTLSTAMASSQADHIARIRSTSNTVSGKTNGSQFKPPPKDLIDEIVLEIARDAGIPTDANCTIQDLNDCNISGIPETLDFDRCFQDVEMMTEEEARKLLSRKSEPVPSSSDQICKERRIGSADFTEAREDLDSNMMTSSNASKSSFEDPADQENAMIRKLSTISIPQPDVTDSLGKPEDELANQSCQSVDSLVPQSIQPTRVKVRFSDQPVEVYDTHAIEDYDRRNDDIDPVAASVEYEIEKSKEREGIRDSDDEDNDNDQNESVEANGNIAERFNSRTESGPFMEANKDPDGRDDLQATSYPQAEGANFDSQLTEGRAHYRKEYVDYLEHEVGLKSIMEQNMRDLQSQYYEAVKRLDETKNDADTKLAEREQTICDLRQKCEISQNQLTDSNEKCQQLEKQLDDTKESSQLLEKKYHRAKKIIKDMQSREESFTRREQLYQQKLDEIEHELGVLIRSIDRTILNHGLKYYRLLNADATGATCQRQHQAKLDVFGLIKKMHDNFEADESSQNAQIKQRVVTILEQQLALLYGQTEGVTSITQPIESQSTKMMIEQTENNTPIHNTANGLNDNSNNHSNNNEDNSSNQNFPHYTATHRLSQPNLPHPIGIGGQPTKIFHGVNPLPVPNPLNETSPPHSVNSYPSSNSLNSLNNHNSNGQSTTITSNNNNNNNTINYSIATKLRDQPMADGQQQMSLAQAKPQQYTAIAATAAASSDESNHKITPELIQAPYQTNEWHEKPVSEWTTSQVSTWLLALGLDQYITKFEDRNVNGQSLINLDSTVLKGLGVLNSHDRNLLKKKIRELRAEMEKERKLNEKKLKENLKDRSKLQQAITATSSGQAGGAKSSWKKGLLS